MEANGFILSFNARAQGLESALAVSPLPQQEPGSDALPVTDR